MCIGFLENKLYKMHGKYNKYIDFIIVEISLLLNLFSWTKSTSFILVVNTD